MTFKCQSCSKSFKLKSELTKHEDTHISKEQFDCDNCDNTFVTKETLSLHERSHEERVQTEHKCSKCE